MSLVEDLNRAKQQLITQNHSLVLVKDDNILFTGKRSGILDLWNVYENQPDLLVKTAAADRVIGKAAAIVMAAGDISACYSQVMSGGAEKIFRQQEIIYETDMKVQAIKKPDTGELCPLEKITNDIDDLEQGMSKISQFMKG